MKKSFVITALFLFVIFSVSPSNAKSKKESQSESNYIPREIPYSLNLEKTDNPQEIDIPKLTRRNKRKKNLARIHLSFKGAFRAQNDWIYLAFTATPNADTELSVSQSELFDGQANEYKYHSVPTIGSEHAFKAQLISGITVPVLIGAYVPVSQASEFPAISKITVTFNNESFQFRNILVEDWQTWEEIKFDLGL